MLGLVLLDHCGPGEVLRLMTATNMTTELPSQDPSQPTAVTRRDFVRSCALGAIALASTPILGCRSGRTGETHCRFGPASRTISLDGDWLFGGKLDASV